MSSSFLEITHLGPEIIKDDDIEEQQINIFIQKGTYNQRIRYAEFVHDHIYTLLYTYPLSFTTTLPP
jgi:hypothetical protein